MCPDAASYTRVKAEERGASAVCLKESLVLLTRTGKWVGLLQEIFFVKLRHGISTSMP